MEGVLFSQLFLHSCFSFGLPSEEYTCCRLISLMAEQNLRQPPVRGYPHLAELLSQAHGGMVRKFNHLAILNILYLQAELFDLEDALATEQETDRLSSTKRQCDWDWLFLSSDVLNQDRKQWKLVLEIREKLAEYREYLEPVM